MCSAHVEKTVIKMNQHVTVVVIVSVDLFMLVFCSQTLNDDPSESSPEVCLWREEKF